MRNHLDPHKTMDSCVQKIRIHFLDNETNNGSVGVLQNLEPFYKTIIGLVHDIQNHKALYGTYNGFRPETAKPCEIC